MQEVNHRRGIGKVSEKVTVKNYREIAISCDLKPRIRISVWRVEMSLERRIVGRPRAFVYYPLSFHRLLEKNWRHSHRLSEPGPFWRCYFGVRPARIVHFPIGPRDQGGNRSRRQSDSPTSIRGELTQLPSLVDYAPPTNQLDSTRKTAPSNIHGNSVFPREKIVGDVANHRFVSARGQTKNVAL